VFAIQDTSAGRADRRQWTNTWLATIWTARPNPPVLVEDQKIGIINRSPTFTRDGQRITFSSDR
jgi:hypothetical protein